MKILSLLFLFLFLAWSPSFNAYSKSHIDYETYTLLDQESKREIVLLMMEFVATLEAKLPEKEIEIKKNKIVQEFWNNIFFPSAIAANFPNNNLCVYAGFISIVVNGKCTHPRNIIKGGQHNSKIKTLVKDKDHQKIIENNIALYTSGLKRNKSCYGTDKILCAEDYFGVDPDTNQPFCVGGNKESENSSLACYQKVLSHEKKDEILDNLIKRSLDPQNIEQFSRKLEIMYSTCMCNESPIINKEYSAKIQKHRTCAGLIFQTKEILSKMFDKTNIEASCKALEGQKTIFENFPDMSIFAKEAHLKLYENIKSEEFAEIETNSEAQNKFDVAQKKLKESQCPYVTSYFDIKLEATPNKDTPPTFTVTPKISYDNKPQEDFDKIEWIMPEGSDAKASEDNKTVTISQIDKPQTIKATYHGKTASVIIPKRPPAKPTKPQNGKVPPLVTSPNTTQTTQTAPTATSGETQTQTQDNTPAVPQPTTSDSKNDELNPTTKSIKIYISLQDKTKATVSALLYLDGKEYDKVPSGFIIEWKVGDKIVEGKNGEQILVTKEDEPKPIKATLKKKDDTNDPGATSNIVTVSKKGEVTDSPIITISPKEDKDKVIVFIAIVEIVKDGKLAKEVPQDHTIEWTLEPAPKDNPLLKGEEVSVDKAPNEATIVANLKNDKGEVVATSNEENVPELADSQDQKDDEKAKEDTPTIEIKKSKDEGDKITFVATLKDKDGKTIDEAPEGYDIVWYKKTKDGEPEKIDLGKEVTVTKDPNDEQIVYATLEDSEGKEVAISNELKVPKIGSGSNYPGFQNQQQSPYRQRMPMLRRGVY